MSDHRAEDEHAGVDFPPGVLLLCLTAIIIALIGAAVSISLATESDARLGSMMAIIGPAIATTITGLLTLGGVRRANRKVDKVLNGVMDAKIKNGVHAALDERDTSAGNG